MGKGPVYARGVRKTVDRRVAGKLDSSVEYAVLSSTSSNHNFFYHIPIYPIILLFLILTHNWFQAYAVFRRYMKKLEHEISKQANGADVEPIHVQKALKVFFYTFIHFHLSHVLQKLYLLFLYEIFFSFSFASHLPFHGVQGPYFCIFSFMWLIYRWWTQCAILNSV